MTNQTNQSANSKLHKNLKKPKRTFSSILKQVTEKMQEVSKEVKNRLTQSLK
jgi:hypothetical protein